MASSKVRREFWERVVSEQRVSGLSGRAWCVQNGVALAAFYAWRKKFSAPATVATCRSSGIQWLALESAKSIAPSASSGVTLRVGTVSIEITCGFDTGALSDVLAVLESRC